MLNPEPQESFPIVLQRDEDELDPLDENAGSSTILEIIISNNAVSWGVNLNKIVVFEPGEGLPGVSPVRAVILVLGNPWGMPKTQF